MMSSERRVANGERGERARRKGKGLHPSSKEITQRLRMEAQRARSENLKNPKSGQLDVRNERGRMRDEERGRIGDGENGRIGDGVRGRIGDGVRGKGRDNKTRGLEEEVVKSRKYVVIS